MTTKKQRLKEAGSILVDLGLPQAQLNDRTALCLLALVDLPPKKSCVDGNAPLVGITPIMEWARDNFNTNHAPNTRETFRRQSMHQFIEAGVCLYNPDKPDRPVNSPNAVYKIEPNLLIVLKAFGSPNYVTRLVQYLRSRKSLTQQYAKEREMNMVSVSIGGGQKIILSPGDHSKRINNIVEDFGARYAPGGTMIYVGDTGNKHAFFNLADRFSSALFSQFMRASTAFAHRNCPEVQGATVKDSVRHIRRAVVQRLFIGSFH